MADEKKENPITIAGGGVIPGTAAPLLSVVPGHPPGTDTEKKDTPADEPGTELPGGFVSGTLVVQCLRCASLLELPIAHPDPYNVVRPPDGGEPEQAAVELYEIPCATCSAELGEPAFVPLIVLAGTHAAAMLDSEERAQEILARAQDAPPTS